MLKLMIMEKNNGKERKLKKSKRSLLPKSITKHLPRLINKIEFTDSCWVWRSTINEGYGQANLVVDYKTSKTFRAHKLIYEILIGPVPKDLVCDHLCRNRACVNPGHIELVTRAENTMRGIGIAPTNLKKTHCKRGHEFTPENIYQPPGGPKWRQCYTCKLNAYKGIKYGKQRTKLAEA